MTMALRWYDRPMASLRVVFMGSPAPVLPVLQVLSGLDGDVVGVYTTPDQATGRGRRLEPTPVKRHALAQGLRVYEPPTLRTGEALDQFKALAPDLVVLAAYGKILPVEFLEGPRWGCVNVHPSLLPRHRGATPVGAAILAGDTTTGTTLFLMDEGVDTGPVLAMREEPVYPGDRTPELTERLFSLGADLVRDTLPGYLARHLLPVPQEWQGVTVSRRLSKEDGELDWTKPAVDLEREVRAYFPWPGSATRWRGKQMQVLEASVEQKHQERQEPGTMIELSARLPSIGVVTSDGVLVLGKVRLEGKRAMAGADLLRGSPGLVGERLPS